MFHSFMNYGRIIALAAKRAIRKLVTGPPHLSPPWEPRHPAGSPLARIVPPADETSALPETAPGSARNAGVGNTRRAHPGEAIERLRPKNLAENFKFRQLLRMVRLVLFDVDGTLVHTGRAGSQAFAKTFATEFNARDGIDKIRFAGRTDVNLVREFFGFHNIPATPENFQRFFERYVFWLDQILAHSAGKICQGVPEFIDGLRSEEHTSE